ncbi:MAG TPA: hypothetical protein PLB10_18970 [Thiolinea sp.]|nr:hypothetical protein [Thiolinea sp.]
MKYLRMEIGKLSKSSRYIQNDPETARRKMLAVIHHKKKANKVGDVAYREYLLAEFGATSSAGLDMASLMRFRDYMQGGGKCILPRPKEKSLQERRVDSLVRLMQLRGGEPFSSLDNAQVALIEHDRGLFDGLGLDAFRKFWGRQKVTKLKRGRKASSQEVPLKRG